MTNASSQFDSMDQMYRYQRYFYDATRKYYLLGRDRLISEIEVPTGGTVLELGCGTARNLLMLARRKPDARLFGLDASAEMLRTAEAKISRQNHGNITLKTALANDFSFDGTFGLDEKFDVCFFSYAISIIPPWRESIESALENLKPGGRLYIVDFFDQAELPAWFGRMLRAWLDQFHVRYPPELLPFLTEKEKSGDGQLTVTPLFRRYSILAELRKSS